MFLDFSRSQLYIQSKLGMTDQIRVFLHHSLNVLQKFICNCKEHSGGRNLWVVDEGFIVSYVPMQG